MLTDYDARAVAEVMGIAFVHSQGTARPPAPKRARAASGSSVAVEIVLGDAALRMVERTSGISAIPPSPALIEKAVAAGLPRGALRQVAEHLAGDDKAKVSRLEWGVVPKTTLDRRETQLSPEESERTERVARLLVHARRALGTEEEAREFMTSPHPRLDGRSPVEAARTDLGTRRVEQILNALEYGLAL
jgi:putative toxin-antitoxin system antitoxin component (TIGR02293 family)